MRKKKLNYSLINKYKLFSFKKIMAKASKTIRENFEI